MSKIDLLQCPFCGRKPKVSELNIHLQQISCLYSKCPAHPCVIKKTMEEAAEAWNTRASGWIPCSERMPEDNTEVIVYDDCFLIATTLNPLPEPPQRKDDTNDND